MRAFLFPAVLFAACPLLTLTAVGEEPPAPAAPALNALPKLEIEAGGSEPAGDVAGFILEIREKLGINPLKGTVLDTPNHHAPAFVAELKRIEKTVPAQGLPAVPMLPEVVENRLNASPRVEPLEPDPVLVDTLRRAAREIDRKANDREMKNDYEGADYLRGVAAQVRGIARRHAEK